MTKLGVRNVALVGHNGSGKTTLAEALLFATGAIKRLGTVDDGSTVSDFEPEEIKYHMSLSLALAPCTVDQVKLNIIDTPGYADFFGEVRAACSVVDLVVLVVSAVEGIEAQTEAGWALAEELGLPRLVFINKLDRERASFDRVLGSLRDSFGAGIAPLELPVGGESGFRGIADLLTDTAIIYDGGRSHSGPIPDDLAATEHEVREQLVEGIVVGDDDLMERYLEGDIPSSVELESTLATGVAEGVVFPVVCGSAVTGVGVDRLATLLAEIAPAPDERPPVEAMAGDALQEITCDPTGQPLARVFKTISDPYVGKISLMRVQSGTIRPDSVLTNPRTHRDERLHVLQLLQGHEAKPANQAEAGDIVAVPKLADVTTGDTLAPKGTPIYFPSISTEPVSLSVAIKPKSKGDEDKLMTGLHRLQEEDPALLVERVDETHQTILRGTGETHLTVAAERLARKFGVEVATEAVLIPYRESITAAGRGRGKVQETERRPWPVRRSVDPDRTPRTRRWLPVRRQGGRRGHPQAVHPGGGEGDRRSHETRWHLRISGGRPASGVPRWKAPPGGLVRDELQDGRIARLQGGDGQGGSGTARAGLAPRGDRAGQHAGERPRRSQRSAGEGAGHRHRPDERAEDCRPGAHRRDPALCDRPPVTDRGQRAVSC